MKKIPLRNIDRLGELAEFMKQSETQSSEVDYQMIRK